MKAKKWSCETHEYEPYKLPLNSTTFQFDMDDMVACAGCGKQIKYGESYTSIEIHTSMGIGYAVCEECHNEEWERSDKNAE